MRNPKSPVVITGGAKRLELATALALHEDGYSVVVTYRNRHPSLSELEKRGFQTIYANFRDENGALGLANELKTRFDSHRAIIHNISEWLPEGKGSPDASVMQRMLNVHVTAPYLLNQESGDLLCRHGETWGYADIIHTSDYVASSGSKKHIAYAASKAAIGNLTLSYASKYAPLVKVHSIAPALLMFNHSDGDSYRRKAVKKSLLGIVPGEAEGVNAIRYILNSRYLTGKTIGLDTGRHLAQAS